MAKVLDKQNIFDLVLQESGGLNSSARVLRDNGLNFNDSLLSGGVVSVDVVESKKIKENYELRRFKPNNEELEPKEVVWILATGAWNDSGVWVDTELWKDS